MGKEKLRETINSIKTPIRFHLPNGDTKLFDNSEDA
jgi:hypothetical protein